MDPNQNPPKNMNPVPPQPEAGPPLAETRATPPVQPPTPTAPPPESPKSNGKIILFIVVGTLLLIVLGVTYFLASQLNSSKQEPITPTPTQVPTPTSTPTPTPLSEKDIDIIDLGDPETDLKGIEDDVKQL